MTAGNDFITTERERLSKQRDELSAKHREITAGLEDLDRQLSALDVYERALSGKTAPPSERAARGSQKSDILEHIRKNPGATRGDITKALNLRGQGVSNVLDRLKKEGAIKAHDKGWHAA